MDKENAYQSSESFEFHHEGTSLDHQVERIRTATDSNTTDQEPNTNPSQTPLTTEEDDEPIGAGRMLYTHEGLVDRSQLPADMLPQTPTPMGDALESTGPDAIDDDFHDHYDAHYATSDFEYVQYEPAYQYGYDLAGESRYRDYDWNHIEPQARTDWEQTHSGSIWDQFRDAVRFGWDLRRGMSR